MQPENDVAILRAPICNGFGVRAQIKPWASLGSKFKQDEEFKDSLAANDGYSKNAVSVDPTPW